MNLANWGFRHWPFDRTFAADRFFSGSLHDEAMARLLFLVEESRRCGILSGPAGTGKTFLLKLVQQRAERMGRMTVRCEATGLNGQELIGQIATGCQIPCDADATPARIWNQLQTCFAGLALIRQPLVVVVDHFDATDFTCQQAIRRLYQLSDTVGLKLTILLATREQIAFTGLQDIVELRIATSPWAMAETSNFIRIAVERAGCMQNLFTDEAVAFIHEATRGIPWSVTSICHLCLLAAQVHDAPIVTRQIVEATARELLPSIDADLPGIDSPSTSFGQKKQTPNVAALMKSGT